MDGSSRLLGCFEPAGAALSPPSPSAAQRPAPAPRPESDADRPPSGPRLFARNRRDGARLLSSLLIITTIGLVAWQTPLGRGVALVGAAVSLFWWLQYRQLQQ